MNLEHLTIMVTRPRPEGEVLCQKIDAANGRAVYLPAIDILPPDDIDIFKQQIKQLDQYDWLIFISPQAVYQSVAAIKAVWRTFPATLRVAAIGHGTAEVLRKQHLPVNLYPESDWRSEGLLELPDFQQVKGKKIALLCGDKGRDFLQEQLILRGALVTRVVAYRRCLPTMNLQKYIEILPNIDIIVCTSNEILQNLKQLFQESSWAFLQTIPVMVVSERMVSYANDLGFQKIILANNASHDAIMSTLIEEKDLL